MSGENQIQRYRTLRGIWGVAQGRASAFVLFGDTPQAFMTSLAPLLAFPVIGSLLTLAGGQFQKAVVEILASVAALLVPPVLSHYLAQRWGREAAWCRFAVAFNWCQFALVVLALLSLTVGGIVLGRAGGVSLVLMLALYGLWLHWFLGRRGLGISAGRAVSMVLLMHLVTTTVVLLPRILAGTGPE